MSAALQFTGIGKEFPGVTALDDVTFGVSVGSVHGLVGENGAGKSTLLKILSGDYRSSRGELSMGGEPYRFDSPLDAIRSGVAVIYQELNLVPEMSVTENLLLGQMPNRCGVIDRRLANERVRRELRVLEENIDPSMPVKSLPIAQRQMVEIAKALMRDACVIAFDEPTSSLTERETGKLFAIIRDLRKQGRVILYVSHRMQEIFEICDAVTVLRDGRHVRTIDNMQETGHDEIVSLMVGRDVDDIYPYAERPLGDPALAVDNILGNGLTAPARLTVKQGEIVGLFGLVGAGRTELLELIFGASPGTGGCVRICGEDAPIRRPGDAISHGIGLCTEDRKEQGIVPQSSVAENINLSIRPRLAAGGMFIRDKQEMANATRQVGQMGIRTPSLRQRIVNLSGGNQQKALLGRWLGGQVKVLLLDEPTRGIDVGAKAEIYAIIQKLAREGVGFLVVSSDLPEVLGICDRVLVMRQGAIVNEFSREDATEETIMRAALPVGVRAIKDE